MLADPRFPITRVVAPAAFVERARGIAAHPSLVIAGDGADAAAREIIASHLAELYFFRPDILERVLHRPKYFHVHRTAQGFAADGGIHGGCYDPRRCCIVIRHSRLFEGFGGDWPGVAPLLHELGHMLDHVNPRTGGRRLKCDGLLPGLHPRDGGVYTPRARELFLAGKALELKRYAAYKSGRLTAGQPIPLGHPYVFQNSGEFCAGYLEMFLRNPNAFACMNTQLYDGYCALFGWDPRTAWPNDFAYYVEQNARVYVTLAPHAHSTTWQHRTQSH